MTIRVALNHVTRYRYDRWVKAGPQVVRLRPAPHTRTPVQAYSLRIGPEPHFVNWQQDPFGNFLARVVFPEPLREMRFEVDLVADMTVINPFDFFLEESAEHCPFEYEPKLRRDLLPYLEVDEDGPLLRDWVAAIDRRRRPTVEFLVDLNRRLERDIAYTVRMEPGVQTCEQTLGRAIGSCRDSGWLLVQILRHLGLAARFVSGYLVQLTPDEKPLEGPAGTDHDFTDLHAWAEVYVPGAGWLGLDPTSGLFAGEGHIPLACTPHPLSAAPITGAVERSEVSFEFRNAVQRIHEDPRVTRPYTDAQWIAVDDLGERVDAELTAGDVRLTMGGEPTFVSVDDMESAQWNTAALGEHKRRLAGDLLLRLAERFAPGALLHYGQGKWYPGEPLPRWALNCFWRADGAPIWRDRELIAVEDRDYGHGPAEAERFVRALAGRLDIDPALAVPGYEDPLYYLWKESGLPEDVDPLAAGLDDPLERRSLAEKLRHGLGAPCGYALPLARDHARGRWRSSRWPFRAGRMHLLPGDSPMGLRLPLDALPAGDEPEPDRDPFEPRPPLADYHGEVARRYRYAEGPPPPAGGLREQGAGDAGARGEAAGPVVRTALCVEARAGRLHVFLPPLTHLEDYLALVAAVEATAAGLGLPVLPEGYPAPEDERLRRFSVTPDPGVIEVNVHPAQSWQELTETTTALYALARESRLGTEKFLLDGRHTGTGGGNHVTLGGPAPADSPMLRRPDLLRSLLTYWQHHPALSYLFSGLFIGPTSQAPRVDEGRDEALYELEIAFAQMPEGEVAEPWLVDRLLRNLLVDVTGNTHRAEFCIDKLYSPDSAGGRRGLVEFRAFEMPPHARMSLVQMLLLRCLIARFWRRPYRHRLVRWGTELHDRFLLPHYVAADAREVAAELQEAGYDFRAEWLDPFVEFRFPHYGAVRVGDVKLELRAAIEPWHVLGEETTNLGTARFVDSSVERLQVKATGLTDSRYLVTCNGRPLPLHNTGTRGEYVAGVRYRAWQPPSALHPTIGVHSPLVFDLVDTWNGRSLGGCTYHVAHPGGRSYDVFPVNAYEAEARRISRFWGHGHTPGVLRPPPGAGPVHRFEPRGGPTGPVEIPGAVPRDPDYPYTLDLRRG